MAISMPLFSSSYFRIDFDAVSVPLPLIILSIILFYIILCTFANRKNSSNNINITYMFICTSIFILSQITSLVFNYPFGSNKELLKLIIGLVAFYFVIKYFNNNRNIHQKFIEYTLWSSTILYAYFIYQSIIIGNSFMAADLENMSNGANKNQMGWYSAALIPFAVAFSMKNKFKFISYIPVIILIVSLIYISSRSSIISGGIGSIVVIFYLIRYSNYKNQIISNVVIITLILVVSLPALFFNRFDTDYIKNRMQWLISPNQVEITSGGKLDTINQRTRRYTSGLVQFQSNPIYGVGISQHPCHSDYFTILSEIGIFGFISFISLILSIFYKIYRSKNYIRSAQDNWIISGSIGSFISVIISSLFIDTYTSPHFWVIIGLIIAFTASYKIRLKKNRNIYNI